MRTHQRMDPQQLVCLTPTPPPNQEKKRQLYQAIQEREQLKERARAAEAKLKEYQEAMHCRLCFTVGGWACSVVGPCRGFEGVGRRLVCGPACG